MIKPPPPQENLDHEDRARRAQPPVLPGACAPRPQRRARLHVRSRLPPLVTAAHTQVRAAAALLAFINALAVSLFGLVPGTNVGYPAAVLGVIGILFTAAGMRSILASPATVHQQRRWQLGLIILLLLIFGVELACGVAVIVSPHSSEPVQLISYALVSSLLVGIARAWELVGGVDTGVIASIAVLSGHRPGRRGPDGVAAPGALGTTDAGDAPGPGPDGHQAGERGE